MSFLSVGAARMHSPTPDSDTSLVTALSTSITWRLSPEVYNIILFNSRNSKQQLTSFSLVSKTWLQLCRHFLFAEVEYRADFARFLTSSPHAALTVAPHIRTVILKHHAIDHEEKLHDLDTILCLPNITSLHAERTNLDIIMARSEISPFRRLRQLNLRSIRCPSFAVFIKFLDSFSALQELSLDTVSWDTMVDIIDRGSSLHTRLKPSSLKKLFLNFCHNRIFLNWLLYGVIADSSPSKRDTISRRTFCSLTTLSLPDILPQEIDILGIFLDTVSETLEHLEIGILHLGYQPNSLIDPLLLAQNTRLQKITFNQVTLFQFPSPVLQNTTAVSSPGPAPMISPHRWIPDLILTAKSGSVHTICFKIWLSAENQLSLLPWTALNITLTDIGISKLVFEISGVGRDKDLVATWFTKHLAINSAKTTVEYNFAL